MLKKEYINLILHENMMEFIKNKVTIFLHSVYYRF